MALFFTALIVGYSGAMMPGPLLTYSIERSLNYGWKTGMLAPLGHIILEMFVVVLLVFGLGSFLNNPLPKTILFFIGGSVLLWFGFDMVVGAINNRLHVATQKDKHKRTVGKLEVVIKSGVISVLNPYFLLWWATIGLGFLIKNGQINVGNILLFYSGHALADFTWYSAVALLCDKISGFIGGKIYRIIITVLGLLLGFFAVKFIVDGVKLVRTLW